MMSSMVSKMLIRRELEHLLKQNDSSIKLKQVQQTDRSSSFWPQFSLIFVNDIVQNFVQCNKCRAIIVYKSATGTGGLKKHALSCEKSSPSAKTQSTITTFYGKKSSVIPEKLRKEITDAYVDFVLLDGRSFKMGSDTGFKQFIDVVYKAGKASTNIQPIEIVDVLPHRTTVSTLLLFVNEINPL